MAGTQIFGGKKKGCLGSKVKGLTTFPVLGEIWLERPSGFLVRILNSVRYSRRNKEKQERQRKTVILKLHF